MLLFVFNFIACLASLILTNSQNDKISLPFVSLQHLSRCSFLRKPCWQICSLTVFHLLFSVSPVNTQFRTSVRSLRFLSLIKMAAETPIKKSIHSNTFSLYYLHTYANISIEYYIICHKYSEKENFISIISCKSALAKPTSS